MGKLLTLTALTLLLLASSSFAGPTDDFSTILSSAPSVKTGIAWDMAKDYNNLISLSSVEIVGYKGFSGNLGLATSVNDKAHGIFAGSVNYNLGNLTKYNVVVPYGSMIEVGAYASRDFSNKVWGYGPVVTLTKKF